MYVTICGQDEGFGTAEIFQDGETLEQVMKFPYLGKDIDA